MRDIRCMIRRHRWDSRHNPEVEGPKGDLSDVRALWRGQGGLRATAEEHVPRRLGVRAALGCRAVAGCSRRELAALRRRSMADVFGVGLAIGGRGAISEFALGSAQPGQCPDGFPRAALQARRSGLGQG